MMLKKGGFLKAMLTAAAIALVAGGAMTGCSQKDDEGWGGDIVGDWMPYSSISSYDGVPDGGTRYYNNSQDEKMIVSFRSSGEASQWGFQKVGNVWVEIPFEAGDVVRWRVEGQTIYISKSGDKEDAWGNYTMSGDNLVVTGCYYDNEDGIRIYHCTERTYTRANVNSIRSSLGTIYINNPDIRGDWTLQGGGDEYGYHIYFGGTYCGGSGVSRYINADNYYDLVYYTNGDNLYLVVKNCDYDDYDDRHCTTEPPVVLPYRITGSGDYRTLTIRNDIWTFRPDDYDYSPAKSRQNKRLSGQNVANNIFSLNWTHP
ncbi:hypothetical protein R80B4_00655 [Fibrobacteres bacterium R8-0-B4]